MAAPIPGKRGINQMYRINLPVLPSYPTHLTHLTYPTHLTHLTHPAYLTHPA